MILKAFIFLLAAHTGDTIFRPSWKVNAFSTPVAVTVRTMENHIMKTSHVGHLQPFAGSKARKHPRNTIMNTLSMTSDLSDTKSDAEAPDQKSTMDKHIFNLVKSIVGSGVLCLPAGISAFANAPSAVIPSTIIITIIGLLSAYGFSLIGRVCAYTGSSSYREAWAKSVGENTSIIPALSCTLKTLSATTGYSMILADTSKSLLATIGINLSRSTSLLSITTIGLLPLCLLKNLSSLAPFSLVGILGMVYTAIAMAIRLYTKAYASPGGIFLADIPAAMTPTFGTMGAASVFGPSSFILICMLSTAYMSHFNAPKFYNELKDNTVKRFNTVVYTSFGISIGFFALIAALGFMTFGSASSGLILNNYSNKDTLMSLSRVAVAISLLFGYPLAFAGCRDGFLDLAKVPSEKRSNGFLNKLTVGLLTGITGLALSIKDFSLLSSLGGATIGNLLIYVYPAIMFREAVKKMGDDASKNLKREVKFSIANAGLGIGMGVIGLKMALKAAFGV